MVGGDKGKELDGNVAKNVIPKPVVEDGDGGSGTGTLEEKVSQGGGHQWKQTPRSIPSETDIASAHRKSRALMAREGPNKGRTGGASSSSVDKLMRPQRTIRKGNTHSKPFMTWELWKACELATEQALLPKRRNFSDINEYNNCCREWKTRESLHMRGDRSSDVQLLSKNTKERETRRNLETHLSTVANRQMLQTPSIQKDGNTESKLTRASRPLISTSPTDGGRQENGETRVLTLEDIEEGECEGLALERIDENMDIVRY